MFQRIAIGSVFIAAVQAQALIPVPLRMPISEYLDTIPGYRTFQPTCPSWSATPTCQKVYDALTGKQVFLPLNPSSMDWGPLEVSPQDGYYRGGFVMSANHLVTVIQVHMSLVEGEKALLVLRRRFGRPSESRPPTAANPTWSETWEQPHQTWIFANRLNHDWLTLEDQSYVRWLKTHPEAAAHAEAKVIDIAFSQNGIEILQAVILDDFDTHARGGHSMFDYAEEAHMGPLAARQDVEDELNNWFALREWPAFAKTKEANSPKQGDLLYLFIVYWAGSRMDVSRELTTDGLHARKFLTESGKIHLVRCIELATRRDPAFLKEYARCRAWLKLPELSSTGSKSTSGTSSSSTETAHQPR